MYAMLEQFSMTLQTEIVSTISSDFLKQMIILKSFYSVLLMFSGFLVIFSSKRNTSVTFSLLSSFNREASLKGTEITFF